MRGVALGLAMLAIVLSPTVAPGQTSSIGPYHALPPIKTLAAWEGIPGSSELFDFSGTWSVIRYWDANLARARRPIYGRLTLSETSGAMTGPILWANGQTDTAFAVNLYPITWIVNIKRASGALITHRCKLLGAGAGFTQELLCVSHLDGSTKEDPKVSFLSLAKFAGPAAPLPSRRSRQARGPSAGDVPTAGPGPGRAPHRGPTGSARFIERFLADHGSCRSMGAAYDMHTGRMSEYPADNSLSASVVGPRIAIDQLQKAQEFPRSTKDSFDIKDIARLQITRMKRLDGVTCSHIARFFCGNGGCVYSEDKYRPGDSGAAKFSGIYLKADARSLSKFADAIVDYGALHGAKIRMEYR